VGRAGFHKHKWLQTIKRGETRGGEKGFVNPARAGSARKRAAASSEISVGEIQREIDAGRHASALGADGVYSISLAGFKVLSGGALRSKIALKASGFSAKAKEKIVAAGGSASTE
jgi:ribosomal protein L15